MKTTPADQDISTYKLLYQQIINACKHIFKREGIKVYCPKCGVEYIDPENKFPIEKANSQNESR